MLKQILIFCFLFGMTSLTQAQHLQLLDNRGEFGWYRGQSSYRGDVAPDIFKFNKISGGYYKKQYNDYAGFKLNYEQLQLGSNDSASKNIYAKNRGFFFSRHFNDISLTGEFYFTRFLPGNKAYRFTPYLGVGVGYLFESKASSFGIDTMSTLLRPLQIDSVIFPNHSASKGIIHFPVQIGFKFNLTRRWNIFAEAMYRFALSDELDFFPDGQLMQHIQTISSGSKFMIGGPFDEQPPSYANLIGGPFVGQPPSSVNLTGGPFNGQRIGAGNYLSKYQGSRSGKDQFFSVKAGISFNLLKIYGEEKFKPGKRSKLASLKEKEAGQNKSGFLGRLKFKRN
ncbi:MAG: hypothetical protein RIQ51_458 [Bacteroidota bacterium]